MSHCPNSREPLTTEAIQELLAELARDPLQESPIVLETLLFHGAQVAQYIEEHGSAPLDPLAATLLLDELDRSHVRISIRVIDDHGVARIDFADVVPIGIKQHLHPEPEETRDVTPPEAGFTVQRVGLHHLWTRI